MTARGANGGESTYSCDVMRVCLVLVMTATTHVVHADATLFAASAESAVPQPPRTRWPEPLAVSFSGMHGMTDWGDVYFEDPGSTFQMPGSAFAFERVDVWGATLTVSYVGEIFRVGWGLGYATPAGGLGGASLPRLGPEAEVERVHLMRWFAEAGLGHRFGDLTLFAVMQAGLMRAIVDTRAPRLMLRAVQYTVGPKLGVRAHVYKTLFVQAAVFANVLRFPDHAVTLGVGVGHR